MPGSPNIILSFLMENHFWGPIGCQPGKSEDQDGPCSWSMANILQYDGMVAIEAANGPAFSDQMRWGRVNAPRIFCTGELQTTIPDPKGGHKEGSNLHGSSPVEEHLQTTYNSTSD